ncbi:hypothetical protein ABEF95_002752 [Exophiala dermatitidis]
MPRVIVPQKSAAHRSTCLSLYRALLRECWRLPPVRASADDSNNLRSVIQCLVRYRFEKDRDVLSPTQVCHGIEAGRGFLQILRSCTSIGNPALGLTHLTQILESFTAKAEDTAAFRSRLALLWKPPPPHRAKYLENIRKVRDKANHVSTPDHPRIFEHPRPLSEVKAGVRKVPNLIVTHGIPVLKYPGPQPVLLNRVLKHKTMWGIKMWQRHKELENAAHLADTEDDWDAILYRQHGVKYPSDKLLKGTIGLDRLPAATNGGTWGGTFREADQELEQKVQDRGRKHDELGRRLWQIVMDERELKEKERREAKHNRRMARKRAAAAMQADQNPFIADGSK